MKKEILRLLFFIVFIGIASIALLLWIAPNEASVSPDSTNYIGGAKSLLSGNGYSNNGIPITHFPPFYSIFLAAMGLFNKNLVQAAHYLNAIFFGINMMLTAWIVFLSVGLNYLITSIAVLFFGSLASFFDLHTWAWSEPLFIALTLACILFLSRYAQRPTLSLLLASSLFFGFAQVTRYVGIAFFPAALGIVYLSGKGQQLNRRIFNTLLWAIVACIPLLVFIARNIFVAESPTNRSFIFHPVSVIQFTTKIIAAFYHFLAPTSLPGGLRQVIFGLLMVMLAAPVVVVFQRHSKGIYWRSIENMIPVSCFLFFFSYLIFLFMSITFFDASTLPDKRITTPIFVILFIGLFPAMRILSITWNKPMIWWTYMIFVTISISIQMHESLLATKELQNDRYGITSYTSPQWENSETIAYIKALPDGMMFLSNGSDAIGFLSSKQSKFIPQKISPTSLEVNLLYNDEMMAMCQDVHEDRALLVYFTSIDFRWFLASQADIGSTCQLPILRSFADGIIFGNRSR
jgi:hypothetical protein